MMEGKRNGWVQVEARVVKSGGDDAVPALPVQVRCRGSRSRWKRATVHKQYTEFKSLFGAVLTGSSLNWSLN